MKGAYIYDGAGWQSLKGPPGPSAVSADAGNALTLGSDGLLMYRGHRAMFSSAASGRQSNPYPLSPQRGTGLASVMW